MNCIGGSNDGAIAHPPEGARHGHCINLPRRRAFVNGAYQNIDPLAPIDDATEVYRVFEFRLKGMADPAKVLVVNSWTDDEAFCEISRRADADAL